MDDKSDKRREISDEIRRCEQKLGWLRSSAEMGEFKRRDLREIVEFETITQPTDTQINIIFDANKFTNLFTLKKLCF